MIYLDSAATTSPKPKTVVNAVDNAMTLLSANPGRSGHELSIKAADSVYACRQSIADFFGCNSPERVVFTSNCTQSINFVLKGMGLTAGQSVVVSSLEHNAVMRPLQKLKENGVEIRIAEVFIGNFAATVRSFERQIDKTTALVMCIHASNVCGAVLPVYEIGRLCKEKSIPFAVDAAQSAGVLPINMEEMNIDYLCLPGHKSLYGPMGTGVLVCRGELKNTLIEGGTGNNSLSFNQPDELPERFESGTVNVPGIAGLKAGIDFVSSKGQERIYDHEMQLAGRLFSGLEQMRNVNLYTPMPKKEIFVPVLCFNYSGMTSMEAGNRLNQAGFAVRPGLHCAPSVHRRLGTIQSGSVRVSFSAFNTMNEVEKFLFFSKKL